MANEISIVIADDHPMFRRGLRQSLEECAEFRILREASDGQAALQMIEDLKPAVAILDISMPLMDGFAVAREVRKSSKHTQLIFLTAHQEESLFEEAMQLGVRGYLLKESSLNEIVGCVRAVAAGQHYTSPAMTTYLISLSRQQPGSSESGIKNLTPTELRVLKLIAEYKTSREIAGELFISYYTVETHRRNICDKLDLHGSHALMKFAMAHARELS
jgi:DNA-binding NarL/FixJ family response regulator